MGSGKTPTALASINEKLCETLLTLCRDPNVAWPYHPRTGKIGGLLIDCLLHSLRVSSPDFDKAVRDGAWVVRRNKQTGGNRRKKRLDLVISRRGTNAPLVAVEAKACMTAHAKAHSRLVAELTSSLDAVLDADANAKFFAIVAINCGDKFTSPLNLPGPNIHAEKDGPALADALVNSLSNNIEIRGTLLLPIRFDNERVCEPFPGALPPSQQDQRQLELEILRSLGLGNP
jgi:hypothetical protein